MERWSVARPHRYAKRCGRGVLQFLHGGGLAFELPVIANRC